MRYAHAINLLRSYEAFAEVSVPQTFEVGQGNGDCLRPFVTIRNAVQADIVGKVIAFLLSGG